VIPVVLATLTLAGCPSKNTVSGTVSYKGKALPAGTIAFFGADNKAVSAQINKDGTYTATGVPVGSVKVTVQVPPQQGSGGPPQMQGGVPGQAEHAPPVGQESGPKEVVPIPPKYASPQTSDLQFDVHRGRNTIDIELK